MKTFYLFLLLALSCTAVQAQETTTKPRPQLLDRSSLSGVGLRQINFPDEPEKQFFQRRLYRGESINIFVVSSDNRNNQMDGFPFDEFVYMLHGEAIIRPESGPSQTMQSRDFFFAHRGYTGGWEIRGGDHFHYELSVIASRRADSSLVAEDLRHVRFSPTDLSGLSISLNEEAYYEQVLQEGVELQVKLIGEAPRTMAMSDMPEQLICLLSGQITITDAEAAAQTFYSGDFFVLPPNCSGTWTSEGHGLVKYLAVGRS